MKSKTILGIVLVPALLLLVPFVAMQFSTEVVWSPFDFALAWVLLAGAGLAYKLATAQTGSLAYRAAAGLAVATALMLVWAKHAVGHLGSEGNPVNFLYGGVLAVGLIGAGLARFRPEGMARALLATALAHGLVSVLAPRFAPIPVHLRAVEVLGLSAFFVMFLGSAWLFRRAARDQPGLGAATTA